MRNREREREGGRERTEIKPKQKFFLHHCNLRTYT